MQSGQEARAASKAGPRATKTCPASMFDTRHFSLYSGYKKKVKAKIGRLQVLWSNDHYISGNKSPQSENTYQAWRFMGWIQWHQRSKYFIFPQTWRNAGLSTTSHQWEKIDFVQNEHLDFCYSAREPSFSVFIPANFLVPFKWVFWLKVSWWL